MFIPLTNTDITTGFEDTHIAESIKALNSVYDDIIHAEKKWFSVVSQFQCPKGCGSCCDIFEPDLLEIEALYMAAWLWKNQYTRACELAEYETVPHDSQFPQRCPMHRNNALGCCSIYGGRALICRLFGSAGDTGRNGLLRYKVCKFHPNTRQEFSQQELLDKFNALPPQMSTFGLRASNILPDSSGKTVLLSTSLPNALRKIAMLKSFGSKSVFGQFDNHDDDTPTPTPTLPFAS